MIRRHTLMNRVCLSVVLLLALLAAASARTAKADPFPLDADTMKAALRTAAPEEDGFIDHVLRKVKRGVLPQDLVESTFIWAKEKPVHKFQYFKQGLIVRAQAAGIKL
jgi:hypothetical protein